MSTSGSDIVRLVVRLLLVVAIVAITGAVSEYYLRKNLSNEDAANVLKYRDVFRKGAESDIFILGNSQSAYGIIPSLLHLSKHKVHNYSFSGGSVSFNRDLYNKYLRKYQNKPQLIIYAVSWFMFDSKVPARKIVQDYQFVPWGVETFDIPPYERFYLIHQLDIISKIFRRPTDNSILVDKYDNGFVPLDGTYTDVGMEIKPEIINSKNEIQGFIELIKLIRSSGIELLLVETPEYAHGVQCKSISGNEKLIRSIADSNNIEYINYNMEHRTDLNDDISCFGDWRHLNYRGAQRFSKMLADDINKLITQRRILKE